MPVDVNAMVKLKISKRWCIPLLSGNIILMFPVDTLCKDIMYKQKPGNW